MGRRRAREADEGHLNTAVCPSTSPTTSAGTLWMWACNMPSYTGNYSVKIIVWNSKCKTLKAHFTFRLNGKPGKEMETNQTTSRLYKIKRKKTNLSKWSSNSKHKIIFLLVASTSKYRSFYDNKTEVQSTNRLMPCHETFQFLTKCNKLLMGRNTTTLSWDWKGKRKLPRVLPLCYLLTDNAAVHTLQ